MYCMPSSGKLPRQVTSTNQSSSVSVNCLLVPPKCRLIYCHWVWIQHWWVYCQKITNCRHGKLSLAEMYMVLNLKFQVTMCEPGKRSSHSGVQNVLLNKLNKTTSHVNKDKQSSLECHITNLVISFLNTHWLSL